MGMIYSRDVGREARCLHKLVLREFPFNSESDLSLSLKGQEEGAAGTGGPFDRQSDEKARGWVPCLK